MTLTTELNPRFRNIALALVIGTHLVEAQTISLFREFSTAAADRATAITADESGIYVFGVGQSRTGLRKYDSEGNELWSRDFSAPIDVARAVADSTGLYLLAWQGPAPTITLRKYTLGGDELWTRQLSDGSGTFFVGGLAVDAGGVYVASGDYTFTYLRKYSPDGAPQWTDRFGNLQTPIGVAVNATGIYVPVKYSNGAAALFLHSFDANGNELFNRQLNSSDVATGFAAAGTSFYIVGRNASGPGVYLRKFDSAGSEVWNHPIEPAPGPSGSMAADETSVYVAGGIASTLPGQCRSGSGGDAFVSRYDAEGAVVWTRQFGTVQATSVSGVAVNSRGVYVAGHDVPDAFRDSWEEFQVFEGFAPETSAAFLAGFEKAPAPVKNVGPRIFPNCIVNAASYVGGGVAPGEIVTIFGAAIGPPIPARYAPANSPR